MAGVSPRWNPFTGKFDYVIVPPVDSDVIVSVFGCDASIAVNDWVYQDPTQDSTVLKTLSNSQIEPTIGIVRAKPTATTCEVVLQGIYTGLALAQRGKFWLADDGSETFSFPVMGTNKYVRRLGISLGNSVIYVSPDLNGLELDDG